MIDGCHGTILGTQGMVPLFVPELVNSQERETKRLLELEKVTVLYEQRKNLKWWDWVTGVAQEVDEQIYFLETGQTKSYGENPLPEHHQILVLVNGQKVLRTL